EKGIEALTDIEVIELLLTFGTPRSDCKQAAIDALAKFGSLPKILSQGTINVNTVYPRELIKSALARHAASLVVAHNHPSDSLRPSTQDEQLTRTLYLMCSFMNINLLDHLIIGAGETVYSFADHGLMDAVQKDCADIRSRHQVQSDQESDIARYQDYNTDSNYNAVQFLHQSTVPESEYYW
ncbi:MAG: JAB domain-containing protein, partial [Candidatus Electrothrix sp.]